MTGAIVIFGFELLFLENDRGVPASLHTNGRVQSSISVYLIHIGSTGAAVKPGIVQEPFFMFWLPMF